jgi:hypothetical protein
MPGFQGLQVDVHRVAAQALEQACAARC